MAYRCIPLQLLTLLGMSSTQMSPPPQRMRSRSNSSWLDPNSWSHWLNWNRWLRRPTAMMTWPLYPYVFQGLFLWCCLLMFFPLFSGWFSYTYSKLLGFSNFASLGARMQWMLIVDLDRNAAPYAWSSDQSFGHQPFPQRTRFPFPPPKKGRAFRQISTIFWSSASFGKLLLWGIGYWVRMFSIKPWKGWYSTPQSPSHSKNIAEAERPLKEKMEGWQKNDFFHEIAKNKDLKKRQYNGKKRSSNTSHYLKFMPMPSTSWMKF